MLNGELKYHVGQINGLTSPELIDNFELISEREHVLDNVFDAIDKFIVYLNKTIEIENVRQKYINELKILKEQYISCLFNIRLEQYVQKTKIK